MIIAVFIFIAYSNYFIDIEGDPVKLPGVSKKSELAGLLEYWQRSVLKASCPR